MEPISSGTSAAAVKVSKHNQVEMAGELMLALPGTTDYYY
jgi:hypothetical protein